MCEHVWLGGRVLNFKLNYFSLSVIIIHMSYILVMVQVMVLVLISELSRFPSRSKLNETTHPVDSMPR